jgi:hypothetical protein
MPYQVPQYIFSSYKDINNSDLIANKELTADNINKFQQYLNNAQAKTTVDEQSKSLIQYLYRRNPNNFCQFLIKSKLNHLILWTEAKCIVRYFGLMGIVYIKWNIDKYDCSLHKQVNMPNDNVQKKYYSISNGEFNNRRPRYNSNKYNKNPQRRNQFNYKNRSYNDELNTNKRSNFTKPLMDDFPTLPFTMPETDVALSTETEPETDVALSTETEPETDVALSTETETDVALSTETETDVALSTETETDVALSTEATYASVTG